MLQAEYNETQNSFNVANLKAEHDLPYVKVEVSRFESVVLGLTSNDLDDIRSRYKEFFLL